MAGLDVVVMGVVDQCRGILLFPASDSKPAEELDDSGGMSVKEKFGTMFHITSHTINITIQRETPVTHQGDCAVIVQIEAFKIDIVFEKERKHNRKVRWKNM